MEIKTAVACLTALAHETRLSLFRMLVQAGPEGITAGRISEHLGISPSSLSFHLKELNRAGLVSATQQGRFVIYAANYEAMNLLLAYLTQNCCQGSPDINASNPATPDQARGATP